MRSKAASPTLARAVRADTSAVGTSLTLLEAIQKEPGRIAGLSGHFGPAFKAGGPLAGIKIPSDACSAPCGSVFVQRGPLQRARISGAAPSGRVALGLRPYVIRVLGPTYGRGVGREPVKPSAIDFPLQIHWIGGHGISSLSDTPDATKSSLPGFVLSL